MIIAAVT